MKRHEVAGQEVGEDTNARLPFAERPTCFIADACAATGMGRTKLYELIAQRSIGDLMDSAQRMIPPCPVLEIDIGQEFTGLLVRPAHPNPRQKLKPSEAC